MARRSACEPSACAPPADAEQPGSGRCDRRVFRYLRGEPGDGAEWIAEGGADPFLLAAARLGFCSHQPRRFGSSPRPAPVLAWEGAPRPLSADYTPRQPLFAGPAAHFTLRRIESPKTISRTATCTNSGKCILMTISQVSELHDSGGSRGSGNGSTRMTRPMTTTKGPASGCTSLRYGIVLQPASARASSRGTVFFTGVKG
jgi:hypothetical protein